MVYQLRPIWEASLEMYQVIRQICEKHHWHLYAVYGTALGAIRHQGFIPWDDDIDLALPRQEYDEFFRIAEKELPSYYKPVCLQKDENHILRFGKVRDLRKDRLEQLRKESNLKIEEGISIDIFPIDGVPKCRLKFFFWKCWMALYKSMMWASISSWPAGKRSYLKMRWLMGAVWRNLFHRGQTWRELFLQEEKIAAQYDYHKTGWLGVQWPTVGEHSDYLPVEVFSEGVKVPFENIEIRVPTDCHAYLQSAYGDYMKLPPEEQRKPAHLM